MKAKAYIVHRAMCEPELEWSKPKDCLSADPLYTTPPQRKQLTNNEIRAILDDPNIAERHEGNWLILPYTFARAIEAAHGIKGD